MFRTGHAGRPALSIRALRFEPLEGRRMFSMPPLSLAAAPMGPAPLPATHVSAAPMAPTSLPAFHVSAGPVTNVVAAPAISPPVITKFGITEDEGVLMLDGVVTQKGASVVGLKVQFGGILAKYHLTAIVLFDGTFQTEMMIPKEGLDGTATAQTVDRRGVASNVAMDWAI